MTTVTLILTYAQATTVMDALANLVHIKGGDVVVPAEDLVDSGEHAAEAMGTYQDVARQLHDQNWGEEGPSGEK